MAELPQLRDPAPYIERRIHKALEAAREEEQAKPGPLRLSQAGDCVRNLWAGLREVPEDKPIEGRILLLFDLGNAVESHLISLLRKADYVVSDRDPKTGEQYRLTDHDDCAVGHIDGEIVLGDKTSPRTVLLEIKSANDRQFQIVVDVGIAAWQPKYVDQATYYMGLRQLKEVLFLVENKNDSQLYGERLKFDPKRFRELRQKASVAIYSESTPDRPGDATSQFCKFCKYCSRNEWCWSATQGVRFDE